MTDEQDKAPEETPVETNQEEAAPTIDLPGVGTVPDPAAKANGNVEPSEDPEAIAAAVRQALEQKGPPTIRLDACPCGRSAEGNINVEVEDSKVGRVTCANCGAWGVDFLVPRTQDKNVVGQAAAKAWNEAPRG